MKIKEIAIGVIHLVLFGASASLFNHFNPYVGIATATVTVISLVTHIQKQLKNNEK